MAIDVTALCVLHKRGGGLEGGWGRKKGRKGGRGGGSKRNGEDWRG